MSCDVEIELHERLGLKDKEFSQQFVVQDVEDKVVIAIPEDTKGKRIWVDRETWLKVNDYVKEKSGEWDKAKGCWTIPLQAIKQPAVETPKPPEVKEAPSPQEPEPPTPAPLEEITEDEAAYLRPTYQKLGALLPVLQTRSGEVIDGKHRRQVDPSWPGHVLYDVDDPVKVAMTRLIINVCRRRVPAEEKTQLLGEIAKLSGWTPQQISEATGMSYTWVMKYLPDEYKEKPGVGPSEYPVTRRVTEIERKIDQAIEQAPVEVQPRIREAVERHKFTPEETEELVKLVEETPSHKLPDLFVTPRAAILEMRAQKRPKKPAPKPQPTMTGTEIECGECHHKFVFNHLQYPDGSVKHKLEELREA